MWSLPVHPVTALYDYSHTTDVPIPDPLDEEQATEELHQLLRSEPEVTPHGTSTFLVATFNLVATIVGGGVLSLPFSFAKMGGLVWGVLFMILAGYLTDQSLVMLCLCARPHVEGAPELLPQDRPHQDDNKIKKHDNSTPTDRPSNNIDSSVSMMLLSSYGQVCRAAYGPGLELFMSALLFLFLVFVLIAYMVLVMDIWTPALIGAWRYFGWFGGPNPRVDHGAFVLLGILIVMAPFLVQKTLHALRFNCYIGFASVSLLAMALCRAAVLQLQLLYSNQTSKMDWFDFWWAPPQKYSDVLLAFPIVMLSYLCHFNIHKIQKALIEPTQARVRLVTHTAMWASGLLMVVFAIGGYSFVLFAVQIRTNDNNHHHDNPRMAVEGNILLNCESFAHDDGTSDPYLMAGRIGCGVTIMLAMAMMLLPCRDSLLEVLDMVFLQHYCEVDGGGTNHHHHHQNNNAAASEATPLMGSATATPPTSLDDRLWIHYGSTAAIVTVCYICAIKAPGVAFVWSLCGSSMAFLIAFILPALCYLQWTRKASTATSIPQWFTWGLLVFAVVGAVVCTTQTIMSIVVAA